MDGTLTRSLAVHPVAAPYSQRGPDRLHSSVAVDLGGGNYMTIPYGIRDDLLPLGGDLTFQPVPPLVGALGASSYVASVEDVTGGPGGVPLTSILKATTRNDATPMTVGPFLSVPEMTSPSASAAWDGQTVSFTVDTTNGAVPDLVEVVIGSGDGSTSWTIVAPGSTRTVTLPNLASHPELGLPGGALNVTVTVATLDAFDYGQLRYGQLSRTAWTKYALADAYSNW
jgi:hypothetical protein